MRYCDMTSEMLKKELSTQQERYEFYKSKKLSYDLTRGKPGSDQLDLSQEMLNTEYIDGCKTDDGTECRNYGISDGIPEAKRLFAPILQANSDQIIVGGNSSLNMMHDILMIYMLLGTGNGIQGWSKQDEVKFICPVPGYDRHFTICQQLGIKMINVPLNEDGPDMDMVEELVKADPSIKGMWSVPKYSNPTGIVYSDECIDRLASMQTAAEDFRIFWDDAYTVHFLNDAPQKQKSIISACEERGNPDRAIVFTSTSKITFPGAGIAACASSQANITYLRAQFLIQSIGPDKLNQLRHVRFLKNYDNVIEHMRKHAQLIAPKFAAVLETLESETAGMDILKWYKPEGGYFISVDTLSGCAKRVVALAKECGVMFTPAGSTYPYKNDPNDENIRIAPTFPPISQLREAVEVFCICVKIASLEKLLGGLK